MAVNRDGAQHHLAAQSWKTKPLANCSSLEQAFQHRAREAELIMLNKNKDMPGLFSSDCFHNTQIMTYIWLVTYLAVTSCLIQFI